MSAVASHGFTVEKQIQGLEKQIAELKGKIDTHTKATDKELRKIWSDQIRSAQKQLDTARELQSKQEEFKKAVQTSVEHFNKLHSLGAKVVTPQHLQNILKLMRQDKIKVSELKPEQLVHNINEYVKRHPKAIIGAVEDDGAGAGVRSPGAGVRSPVASSAVASSAVASPSAVSVETSPEGCFGKLKKCFTRRRSPSRGGRRGGKGKSRRKYNRKSRKSRS